MKYNKGFGLVGIVILVVALLAVGGAYYVGKKANAPAPVQNLPENNQPVVNTDIPIQNTDLKSFKLGTLEFSYPSNLIINKEGETISLSHSIPFRHVNSCDLKDGLSIDEASDFGASFKIINLDLKNSIKKDNPNMLEAIFKGDTIITDSGFVEKYKIGLLDGYKITSGVEGCGIENYYFPISSTKTLFVSKNFYLQTLQVGREKLEKIPGFISSTQEESIFKEILSSIKGLEQTKTLDIKLFFPNSVLDPGFLDCNVVRSTTHTIPYTVATAQATLKELIKGPTASEKAQGFQTSINSGTTIKSISIVNGIAYVDFSKDLQKGNLGLCAGQFIQAQIRQTLLQFPTIKGVIISIEGDKDFVQP